jgi:hypothetical protein
MTLDKIVTEINCIEVISVVSVTMFSINIVLIISDEIYIVI